MYMYISLKVVYQQLITTIVNYTYCADDSRPPSTGLCYTNSIFEKSDLVTIKLTLDLFGNKCDV